MHRRTRLALLAVIVAALGAHPSAGWAQAGGPTVTRALSDLEAQGALAPDRADGYISTYKSASRLARTLPGAKGRAMAGLVADVRLLSRANTLAPRLNPVFAALQVNVAALSAPGEAPAAGSRARLAPAGSTWTAGPGPVTYQWVPDHGWQFHPLANFGELAGVARTPSTRRATLAALRARADALLWYGVDRGYLAFEYQFPWSGAPAPYVSGMAQGAGVRALGLVSAKLGDPVYAQAGERMLGAFETPAPMGVSVTDSDDAGARAAGPHYLLYSSNPGLRVGNGFAQALLGLHDFTRITGSARAAGLFSAGERRLRAELPGYDTGAWSRYSLPTASPISGRESDLHYHNLLGEYLGGLCARLGAIGGGPYCAARTRFGLYTTQPVVLGAPTWRAQGRRLVEIRIRASKRSALKVSVWRGSKLVGTRSLAGHGGVNAVPFPRPVKSGAYRILVEATSLTGLSSGSEARRRLPRRPNNSPSR